MIFFKTSIFVISHMLVIVTILCLIIVVLALTIDVIKRLSTSRSYSVLRLNKNEQCAIKSCLREYRNICEHFNSCLGDIDFHKRFCNSDCEIITECIENESNRLHYIFAKEMNRHILENLEGGGNNV